MGNFLPKTLKISSFFLTDLRLKALQYIEKNVQAILCSKPLKQWFRADEN